MKFINFFPFFWVNFALLDLDPDPIQIRIRIHNTGLRVKLISVILARDGDNSVFFNTASARAFGLKKEKLPHYSVRVAPCGSNS
jgi:hypothetical protein